MMTQVNFDSIGGGGSGPVKWGEATSVSTNITETVDFDVKYVIGIGINNNSTPYTGMWTYENLNGTSKYAQLIGDSSIQLRADAARMQITVNNRTVTFGTSFGFDTVKYIIAGYGE